MNRSFEQALGYMRAEMYGKGLMSVVMSDDLLKFIQAFTRDKDREPFRLLHKDHGVVTCRLMRWSVRHERSFIVMRRAHD